MSWVWLEPSGSQNHRSGEGWLTSRRPQHGSMPVLLFRRLPASTRHRAPCGLCPDDNPAGASILHPHAKRLDVKRCAVMRWDVAGSMLHWVKSADLEIWMRFRGFACWRGRRPPCLRRAKSLCGRRARIDGVEIFRTDPKISIADAKRQEKRSGGARKQQQLQPFV